MIRDAKLSDIDQILILGKHFYDATEYGELMEFSVDATTKTIEHLINDESGILLVSDDDGDLKGMASALIYPFYMTAELTGQELFWWCEDKGQGMALLDALEDKAKEKGAKTFSMISLDNLTPERLDKIYLEKGYTRSEHTYIKGL